MPASSISWQSSCLLTSETEAGFPAVEHVFRSYLLTPAQLENLRLTFKGRKEKLARLRARGNLIDSAGFDDFFLPADHGDAARCHKALDRADGSEIVHKYAYLSYLVTDELDHQLRTSDYFRHTVFAQCVARKFGSSEKLFSQYMAFKEKMEAIFNTILSKEADRLAAVVDGEGDEIQSSGNTFSQKFGEVLSDLVLSPKPAAYVTCQFQEETQTSVMLRLVFEKIEDLLFENHNSPSNFVEYRNFLRGELSESNIKLVKALFAKANAELGFFKLPWQFAAQKNVEITALIKGFLTLPKKQDLFLADNRVLPNYDFQALGRRLNERILRSKPELEEQTKGLLVEKLGGLSSKVKVMSAEESQNDPALSRKADFKLDLGLSENGQLMLGPEETKRIAATFSKYNFDFSKLADAQINSDSGKIEPLPQQAFDTKLGELEQNVVKRPKKHQQRHKAVLAKTRKHPKRN